MLKGGQLIHSSGGYVLDRIQSAGPGDLNIPEEKIYELGNFESIATVRDIPEISFDLESFDMSCEFEALLINQDPTTFPTTVGNNEIDFRNAVPIDIISPWKSRRGQFDIVKGVSVPYLTLESATYRFGVGENSTQSFSLRGDSIFYTPGQVWSEEFPFASGTLTYTLDHTATVYVNGLDNIYVLSVLLTDSTSNAYKRVFFDDTVDASTDSGFAGYTNTSTTLTLPEDESATYDTIKITYGTDPSTQDYPQEGTGPHGTIVHATTSVKPAAVRGKDVDVYIGTTGATPIFSRLNSVQNFEVTWTATLENDEELGNERYVATEYDIPEVNGSIGVKPFDPADLFKKISQITGVSDTQVIGPNVTAPVPLEIRVSHPDSGVRLKTFYIKDAQFSVPGYTGQVNASLETSFSFTSDGGSLKIYNGNRV